MGSWRYEKCPLEDTSFHNVSVGHNFLSGRSLVKYTTCYQIILSSWTCPFGTKNEGYNSRPSHDSDEYPFILANKSVEKCWTNSHLSPGNPVAGGKKELLRRYLTFPASLHRRRAKRTEVISGGGRGGCWGARSAAGVQDWTSFVFICILSLQTRRVIFHTSLLVLVTEKEAFYSYSPRPTRSLSVAKDAHLHSNQFGEASMFAPRQATDSNYITPGRAEPEMSIGTRSDNDRSGGGAY